jgi:hypothetical protein
MTFEQFKYFLDAYGASFQRWPAERRGEAEAFLADSAAAAAALDEALRLDAGLDLVVVARDVRAERRVIARLGRQVAELHARRFSLFEPLFGSLGSVWSRAAIVAAVALLGIVTGVIELQQPAVDSAIPDYVQGPADVGPIELADL